MKKYTLRYLYYRKIPNLVMGKISTDKYKSSERCSECKSGVNARMGYMTITEDGTQKWTSNCPHCSKEYIGEPNTNISYKLYKLAKLISKLFWGLLDKLHLVRSSILGRYDIFGDEAHYVRSWGMHMDKEGMSYNLKKRKWWEYILIEKR